MFPCLNLSKSLIKSETLILSYLTFLLILPKRSFKSCGASLVIVALFGRGLFSKPLKDYAYVFDMIFESSLYLSTSRMN